MKENWARRHKYDARELERDKSVICVYSDGSSRPGAGRRLAGAGGVCYRGDVALFTFCKALGAAVESHEAEMEGLAIAAEMTRDWIESGNAVVSRICFYSDYISAVEKIYKGESGSDQAQSLRFRRAINHILDKSEASIVLEWVPGHQSIAGNDLADKLARAGGDRALFLIYTPKVVLYVTHSLYVIFTTLTLTATALILLHTGLHLDIVIKCVSETVSSLLKMVQVTRSFELSLISVICSSLL